MGPSAFILLSFLGLRCETRWLHLPYKPLSQRMLEEPFWLGLMTIAIVLIVIAFVWCAKRHFAEKFERFVSEELERGKSGEIEIKSWREAVGEKTETSSLNENMKDSIGNEKKL